MGVMCHHAIVITSFDEKAISDAHTKALQIFPAEQVTSVTPRYMNGYQSFLIGPDGSKEGWEDSYIGDTNRERFVEWLNSYAFDDGSSLLTWVEVEFGNEYGSPQTLCWGQ